MNSHYAQQSAPKGWLLDDDKLLSLNFPWFTKLPDN
jgi:hypothetical protein